LRGPHGGCPHERFLPARSDVLGGCEFSAGYGGREATWFCQPFQGSVYEGEELGWAERFMPCGVEGGDDFINGGDPNNGCSPGRPLSGEGSPCSPVTAAISTSTGSACPEESSMAWASTVLASAASLISTPGVQRTRRTVPESSTVPPPSSWLLCSTGP
jgi:hypothetical protein